MRFRKVLQATGDNAAIAVNPPTAAPSADPSGSAAPKPSASAGASKAPAITGSVAPSASTGGQGGGDTGGQGGGERAPAPSASPPRRPLTRRRLRPRRPPLPRRPRPRSRLTSRRSAPRSRRRSARRPGPRPSKLTAPVDLSTDPTAGLPFKAFSTLTGAEVNALTPEMQFYVPTIGCDSSSTPGRTARSTRSRRRSSPARAARRCTSTWRRWSAPTSTPRRPQLDTAAGPVGRLARLHRRGPVQVDRADPGGVPARRDDTCLTAAQALSTGADALPGRRGARQGRSSRRREIQGVLTGQSQITGQFTATSARELADQIKYGALPVTFEAGPAQTVSATLGLEQLEAGLLAAAIGMAPGGGLRVLLLPPARLGHLPEPGAVRPADLRRAGRPRPHDGLHADPGRYSRLHRVARCRSGLVRHLLREIEGRDPRGPQSRAALCPGPGSGRGVPSSPRTPSPSWRRWCCTSCRSAR